MEREGEGERVGGVGGAERESKGEREGGGPDSEWGGDRCPAHSAALLQHLIHIRGTRTTVSERKLLIEDRRVARPGTSKKNREKILDQDLGPPESRSTCAPCW